jgi:hypothetical protein
MGEPVCARAAVVFGPHTETFLALVAASQANDAGVAIARARNCPRAARPLADRAAGRRARAKSPGPHRAAARRPEVPRSVSGGRESVIPGGAVRPKAFD